MVDEFSAGAIGTRRRGWTPCRAIQKRQALPPALPSERYALGPAVARIMASIAKCRLESACHERRSVASTPRRPFARSQRAGLPRTTGRAAGLRSRVAVAVVLEFIGLSFALRARRGNLRRHRPGDGALLGRRRILKPWRCSTDQPLGYFYLNAVCSISSATGLPIKLLNASAGAFSCRYVFLIAREPLRAPALGGRVAVLRSSPPWCSGRPSTSATSGSSCSSSSFPGRACRSSRGTPPALSQLLAATRA